jgi:polar amino acid transport system substrate-binding protein
LRFSPHAPPRRRRFWLAIVGLITVTAAGVSAQRVPLRFVSTAWPPFTNTPGQPRFALELVDEALKRIGESADTTIVDEAAFTTALLGNEFDGSAAAWKDAEREKRLLYSEPYLENRLVLVGRRGSDVSAASFDAVAGKRIAVVGGYSYGDAVTSKSGPIFVRSRGEEDSMAKLLANEVDYTLMDELVVQYLLDHYGEQARSRLELGAHPLVTRTLHVTIRRERPDAASIIRRFNAELRKMVADRTYQSCCTSTG